MPGTAPEISEACQPIMRVEAAVAHSERYAAHKDDYRANIKALIEAGLATDSDAYAHARDFVRTLREAMSERLDTVDALLLPTAPGTAPASLETTGPGIFCGPASFTGLPAISLPSGSPPPASRSPSSSSAPTSANRSSSTPPPGPNPSSTSTPTPLYDQTISDCPHRHRLRLRPHHR